MRRLLLTQEPIGAVPPEYVAERLAAIGTVVGEIKIDDLADVAYIVLDTDAGDSAVLGIACGWRIWRGPRRARLTRRPKF